MKPLVWLAAIVTLCNGAVLAADEHPAQQLLVTGTGTVLTIIKNNSERLKTDEAFLREVVDVHIAPHIDFAIMTKLAVGKYWKKASSSQRETLIKQFHLLLINTYSNALTKYVGQKMDFLPFLAGNREDRAVVRSEFQPPGGGAVAVNYKLRSKEGQWLVYDIQIGGVSLVTSYRSGFTQKINEGGIDGLIDGLIQKNTKG